MITNFFMIVNSNGTVRAGKKWPINLQENEIVISMKLEIPNAAFMKPKFQATVTIPENLIKPTVISADVQDNIKNAIAAAAGIGVTVTFNNLDNE